MKRTALLVVGLLSALVLAEPPADSDRVHLVECLGDSLTAGFAVGAANSVAWPQQLRGRVPRNYVPVNFAKAGSLLATVKWEQWTRQAKADKASYVVLFAGINDLAADTTGAALWSQMEAFAAEVQATGSTVVICTMAPWKASGSWSAGRQTQTEAYNASIRSWANGTSRRLCELYNNMGAGDPAVLAAAYDGGDGIHFSIAGHAKVADLVDAVIP